MALLLLGQDHDRSVRGGNCRRRFPRGQQVRPRKSRGKGDLTSNNGDMNGDLIGNL